MTSVLERSRARRLAHELATFGAVGLTGYVVDVSVFNLLRYAGPGLLEDKPLTAKAISVFVATLVTYFGNRTLTWRHRARASRLREYSLFFVFNGIGMAIALGCLAVSHYLLDLTSPLADNISANVVGLALGTAFRFWAYRTFVFNQVRTPPESAPEMAEITAPGR
ncbi:GtrA family protein [Mumia sp. zg.B53]|uniref:GtrA family protein n=1 Tax=unclassified Mumia TaxID=2621872 RepID=UPI001C6EF9C0|nr:MULTISPECIES: GtrA family protein [unclassified Mumia]MBW9206912.1 GtrA family protein [Mumia sp. zg.B17]MBW9215366.1 GtrA family protein [Mumia sp. zg.B53]MDD9348378.1 GtrA family protein [Mumia sp.]